MSSTLETLRQIREERFQLEEAAAQRERLARATCAELAAPLIAAFREIENEFASIRQMKQVWPEDFSRRDDRVRVFLARLLGPDEAPHGIVLHIPAGSLRFEVTDIGRRGLEFVSQKEVWGQKAAALEFPNHAKWFEYFLRVLSDLVEL